MRLASMIAGLALPVFLGSLTAGHVALNFGGFAAFAQRLNRGANARGEVVVGHLPVT